MPLRTLKNTCGEKNPQQVSRNLLGMWVVLLSQIELDLLPTDCNLQRHCAPERARYHPPAIRGWRGGQCVPRLTGRDKRGSAGPMSRWFRRSTAPLHPGTVAD